MIARDKEKMTQAEESSKYSVRLDVDKLEEELPELNEFDV